MEAVATGEWPGRGRQPRLIARCARAGSHGTYLLSLASFEGLLKASFVGIPLPLEGETNRKRLVSGESADKTRTQTRVLLALVYWYSADASL